MTARIPTTADCVGCVDDFYNGKNDLGVKRCWHLDGARFVRRLLVPLDLRPPYDASDANLFLSCYRRDGCASVSPDSLTEKGYWK